ncbi:unnamed protein product [Adineta ricciae]|uniref:Myeloid leukemia factor n=1 Tax=Adineta ricciae TaxID=249248 RepID=A0A814RRC0_ADIRI|nr:unnamed protein product [Adineta ricciae]
MFGFPTGLFGMHGGDNRSSNNNSLIPHQPSLFGNSFMIPSPFGGMNGLFDEFGINSSPFAMMDRMMRATSNGLFLGGGSNTNGPVHSFTSTTVMSYNGSDGRPTVYQESTSRTRGPGGLEETRQAIRDSERGINKVQIGHRIGDRKHVIEREMNVETGQISENVELENLDEEQTDEFKREWRQRSVRAGIPRHSHHPYHHQITSNRHHPASGSHQPQLALEYSSSSGLNRHHKRPVRQMQHSSQRPTLHHSDTIDLTRDSPIIEEVDDDDNDEQLPLPQPLPVKRKASSSSSTSTDMHRKHRQKRF